MEEQRYEIDRNPELEAEVHRRLKHAKDDREKAEAFALLTGYGWYDTSGEWIYYLRATAEQHRERAQAKRTELDRLRSELDALEE
jgi:hypothetical protein